MAQNKEVCSTQRRHRAESLTSRRFYDSEAIDTKLISLIETAESVSPKDLKTKQSRHLPYWSWFIIAKCNGIPLTENDKPIFGTLLHMFTFASAITYASSYTWYIVYDILSPNTKSDIPGGTVSVFIVVCWCAFGFYCKTLCSRLFLHRRFLKDVRMHSRTVLKVNASVLACVIGILYTACYVVEAADILDPSLCMNIDLHYSVCTILSISSMVFTLFTLTWHTFISFVFISVCRTHTIGLRCFIKELEHDSALLQYRHSSLYKQLKSAVDDDDNESDVSASFEDAQSKRFEDSISYIYKQSTGSTSALPGEVSILLAPVSENLNSGDVFLSSDEITVRSASQEAGDGEAPAGLHQMSNVQTMTSAEILHNFWKLNRRLRFSSATLQRWFASFLALVLLRCSTYLVHWLGHVATMYDILQFALPLMLLVLISSALAEVNFEGQRFQRSIYPTDERLRMFQFLSVNPLQMPIYGFGMTHGTIVTVIFAILVGFVTRIVITELTK